MVKYNSMMTYKSMIDIAIQDKNSWIHCNEDLAGDVKLNLEDAKSCKRFIREFFHSAGKNGDLIKRKINKLDSYRLQHIVSVFFYGIALYHRNPVLKAGIDRDLDIFKGFIWRHHENPFPFVWFLICLYHDLAYAYESTDKDSFASFEKLIQKTGKLGDAKGIPILYKNLHSSYFKYIKDNFKGKCDHGICAGYMLYHDCCNMQKENEGKEEGKWDPRLVKVYNYAAWVVSCHNMWTANEETKSKYNSDEYKLQALDWMDGKRPITIEEYPVFFLLCLVDSTEPIKAVFDVALLDKILVEIDDEALILDIKIKCSCRNKIDEKIGGLNNWLTKATKDGNKWYICLHNCK